MGRSAKIRHRRRRRAAKRARAVIVFDEAHAKRAEADQQAALDALTRQGQAMGEYALDREAAAKAAEVHALVRGAIRTAKGETDVSRHLAPRPRRRRVLKELRG